MLKSKLVMGIGINDADYFVRTKDETGNRTICLYYNRWSDMLRRCYDTEFLSRHPSYKGCSVCEEWLTFSKFKGWMEQQDWVGMHLDKDLLIKDNNLYSPHSCIFISQEVNKLLCDSGNIRGNYMIGVSWSKYHNKFESYCTNGRGKKKFLGLFENELSAHLAWKTYKHNLACKLADEQTDPRVAEALRTRFK